MLISFRFGSFLPTKDISQTESRRTRHRLSDASHLFPMKLLPFLIPLAFFERTDQRILSSDETSRSNCRSRRDGRSLLSPGFLPLLRFVTAMCCLCLSLDWKCDFVRSNVLVGMRDDISQQFIESEMNDDQQ